MRIHLLSRSEGSRRLVGEEPNQFEISFLSRVPSLQWDHREEGWERSLPTVLHGIGGQLPDRSGLPESMLSGRGRDRDRSRLDRPLVKLCGGKLQHLRTSLPW